MATQFDGAVAVVTGASSGIGAELARQLAPRVRVLILVARRVDRLDALAADLRQGPGLASVDVRPCDIGNPTAVEGLAAEITSAHGAVDILINCAGMGDIGMFEAADGDKLVATLQVNVVGLTVLTRALLPGMVARGHGGVLNVSSGFGLTWMPIVAVYCASKHYVSAFSESLRCEVAGTGVSITQVCPGPVATEFEQVAGNPTGQTVPAFLELSASVCARQALRAFERGRALVIPGFWAWVLVSMGRISPSWFLRIIYSLLGRFARRRLLVDGTGVNSGR
ncbi:MAG: SDR family oxidoreductase [Oligoflexia bacterium]|nr:SDR family oxidoreductase [Oligoflexia bacterium]